MKQNLHVHTSYADGKDTPREVVLAAIEQGFDSIGFSEHSYMAFSSYPYQMKEEKYKDYKNEVYTLKEEYRGIIDIFCGMELEYYSNLPAEQFDYLIGSVHYLDFGGALCGFDRSLDETALYINNNCGGDGLAFAKKYFETVAAMPQKFTPDILGHFDLVTKNNEQGRFIDTSSKEYLYAGYEAIHALKGKIPLFEVNTGAISRGYRTSPYPQTEFLKEFKNCGFGAVISSDCHNKDYLGCCYPESRELLLSAGFKSIWILTDKGFREVAL